jgi:hypothetical protein
LAFFISDCAAARAVASWSMFSLVLIVFSIAPNQGFDCVIKVKVGVAFEECGNTVLKAFPGGRRFKFVVHVITS